MSCASNPSLVNQVPAELTAFAGADMLTLIFQNLISNAIDYTPHGEVIVEAHVVKVSVESEVGHDPTFRFTIPLAARAE